MSLRRVVATWAVATRLTDGRRTWDEKEREGAHGGGGGGTTTSWRCSLSPSFFSLCNCISARLVASINSSSNTTTTDWWFIGNRVKCLGRWTTSVNDADELWTIIWSDHRRIDGSTDCWLLTYGTRQPLLQLLTGKGREGRRRTEKEEDIIVFILYTTDFLHLLGSSSPPPTRFTCPCYFYYYL